MAIIGRLNRLGQLTMRNGSSTIFRMVPAMINSTQLRTRVNLANPGIPYPREGKEETEEEFDQRYVDYFSRPDIDGWELRKGINDMQNYDLIPEPKIMIAVLKACRRVNDHSLAVRYLEAVATKANYKKDIMEYLMNEVRPTINELGISTPEDMGYNEPELALGDPTRSSMIEKPI